MREEKVLILDHHIDSGEILKEHINSFGYFKVYLSTNREILEDLTRDHAFNFIFIDAETITLKKDSQNPRPLSMKSGAVIVVIHSEFDAWAKELMDAYKTGFFLQKPFNLKRISEILSKVKLP